MGPRVTKEEYIRKHPKLGQADEFYFACREGNIEYVRQVLPTISIDDLNKLQPNGSTYLHVASHTGRTDIVRLLLKYGCSTSKINRYGLTAYEEAWSDEIRKLFHRPKNADGSSPFVDIGIDGTFQLMSSTNTSDHAQPTPSNQDTIDDNNDNSELDGDVDFMANQWIDTFNRFDKYSAMIFGQFLRSSILCRLLGLKRSALHSMMCHVIDISMKEEDLSKSKIRKLIEDYKTKMDLKLLLTLYTHESSFYKALRDSSKAAAFSVLLYRNLSLLKSRFYKGCTYRGMKLTKQELSTYWAAWNRDGFAFMNNVFQSSSKDESIAKDFLSKASSLTESTLREYEIIIKYEFPKTCESAIDLGQIGNEESISVIPGEAEVLILPYTLFEIVDMTYDGERKSALIHLKYVEPRGIFACFNSAMKEFRNMTSEDIRLTISRMESNMKAVIELQNNSTN